MHKFRQRLKALNPKDGGYYGWVVAGALAIVTFVMMGLSSSFGVFFKSFGEAFDLSRATTSSVLSVRMALGSVFAILGGWAVDRYGSRSVLLVMGLLVGAGFVLTGLATEAWHLFVTYGLLLGAGIGAVYVVMSSAVLRWFSQRRGLALGITGSGGGLGVVLMAPLAAFLVESLDWRAALLILGAIGWLVIVPVSRLVREPPRNAAFTSDETTRVPDAVETGGHPVGPVSLSVRGVLSAKNFWLFLCMWVLMAFSMFFVLAHIVPHATDLGFSPVESATVLSLTGIGMVAGRFVSGLAADRASARVSAIACAALQVGALLWVVQGQQLLALYLFGLLYGIAQGGISVTTTIMVGETFDLSHIGRVLGLLEIGFAAGSAGGPFLGGLIFDMTGNYTPAFLVTAASVMVMAFVIAINRPRRP